MAAQPTNTMEGTPLAEVRLLIEALGTLILEYGATPERAELLARLETERVRRVAEIEACR